MRAMGNGRFEVQCFDGKTRTGKSLLETCENEYGLTKMILYYFSKWEFTTDDGKCSIIHKYDIDESKRLQKEGEFPDTVNLDEENTFDTDDNFTFDYDCTEILVMKITQTVKKKTKINHGGTVTR